jgi:hypothetical protein
MANSPNLALPYIDQNQSQKHVTHNAAIRELDAIVQLSVIDDSLTAPPGSPADGDRYIVATSATGAWAGKDGKIAAWQDGAWSFYAPRTGWLAFIASRSAAYLYASGTWVPLVSAIGALAGLAGIGILSTADTTNRLSVKSDAALFTHDDVTPGTGDMRFTLNKESAAKTVSQLYQTNWSGRAEVGLTGDDDFHVKVSADGSTWREALVVDRATGRVAFPSGAGDGAPTGFRNRLRNASFAINQRAVSGTVTLAAGAYGHDGVKAGSAGATYTFSTSGVDTTIAISSGSLIMPIEAAMIEGGVYTLSQAGTAQARVWQGTGSTGSGSYAAAPFTTASLTAATQTNVEFSTGTILRPQFEAGSFATTFDRRPISYERLDCLRYLIVLDDRSPSSGIAYTASNVTMMFPFTVPLRADPTVSLLVSGSWYVSDEISYDKVANPVTLYSSAISANGGRLELAGFSGLSVGAYHGTSGLHGTAKVGLSAEI